MTTAIPLSLPPGDHAPLAAVDANHHGGWVVICNAFGLLVILFTLLIRVYIRVKVSPPFGADDITLTAATLLTFVQSGLVFAQVHHGLGRAIDLIDAANIETMYRIGRAADIFYVVGLYASKCCVVLLYKRIAPDTSHSLVAWTVLGMCVVFGVISTILAALQCGVPSPSQTYHDACPGRGGEWAAVTALDVLSELALFAMSVHLVWNLQTNLSRKGRVVFAFGLRLPIIAVAAVRLRYIFRQLTSSNPTLVGAASSVLTQLELFYGLTAATIPCLRPFLAGFVTNYGAMGGSTVIDGSQVGTGSGKDPSDSYALMSVASGARNGPSERQRSRSRPRSPDVGGSEFRPDRVRHECSVTHGKSRSTMAGSVNSDESTQMIIKKEVQWYIDSEGGRVQGGIGVSR